MMPLTVTQFCEEIEFLEDNAKKVLKDNYVDGWYINANGYAELDISNATWQQRSILLRRLAGYNPKAFGDRMVIVFNQINQCPVVGREL